MVPNRVGELAQRSVSKGSTRISSARRLCKTSPLVKSKACAERHCELVPDTIHFPSGGLSGAIHVVLVRPRRNECLSRELTCGRFWMT